MRTQQQIDLDISDALSLREGIAARAAALKEIEERLKADALEGESQPLVDAERDGAQVKLGTLGVPVIIEADTIRASIPEGGEDHATLAEAYGGEIGQMERHWRHISILERSTKDGLSFRRLVRETCSPETAERVISASVARDKHGVGRSRIVIAWDRVKGAAQ